MDALIKMLQARLVRQERELERTRNELQQALVVADRNQKLLDLPVTAKKA